MKNETTRTEGYVTPERLRKRVDRYEAAFESLLQLYRLPREAKRIIIRAMIEARMYELRPSMGKAMLDAIGIKGGKAYEVIFEEDGPPQSRDVRKGTRAEPRELEASRSKSSATASGKPKLSSRSYLATLAKQRKAIARSKQQCLRCGTNRLESKHRPCLNGRRYHMWVKPSKQKQ